MQHQQSPNHNHRPFHIYYGHTYFITARCYKQESYFNAHDHKQAFIKKFSYLASELKVGIIGWSLLSNHYHAIIRLPLDEKYQTITTVLPNLMRKLHAQTSAIVNQLDNTPGRQVWYQYWDYYMRSIPDFWKHFNYIVQQPLKHQVVKTLSEAYDYQYSSNPVWLKRFGVDGLSESFIKHPVKNWTPANGVE